MYGHRDTLEFIKGILELCELALKHQAQTGDDGFFCPCVDCSNVIKVGDIDMVREYVFRRGFRPNYHVWVWHGEQGVFMGDHEVNDVHEQESAAGDHVIVDDVVLVDDEDKDEVAAEDKVNEMMNCLDNEIRKHPSVFESLSEAATKALYPGCIKYTKLSVVLTLFNI